MPLPTKMDVHVNRPLTNISVALMQDEKNFIADQVFPIVPVAKQGDRYYTYDNAYWNRDEMQPRAPSTAAARNGYSVDGTPTYFCVPYAFAREIDDQIRANADSPLNLDAEATKYVTLKALLKREILFASAFMTGGVWTNRDYDGVASSPSTNEVLQWNDASSTPIEDVWAAKQAILEATGLEPNVLCIGYPVYVALVNHPDFVDRVKYGQTTGVAMIDTSEMAQLFKVNKVVVMKSIYNTALEGSSAASHSFIGGKKALLVHAATSPGLMTPTGGYIFSWTGYLGGAGAAGQRILRYRDDKIHSDVVEIECAFDMKLVSLTLGAFWDTIVS